MLEILSPIPARQRAPETPIAPRLERLEGCVLGVIDNRRPNADLLLERLVALLRERARPREILVRRKPTVTEAAPFVDEFVTRCDAVINAVVDHGACMAWSDAIFVMLVTLPRWRTFTDRPLPAAGSAGHMLSLSMDSKAAVDAAQAAAAAHGGKADANPPEDHGFMYSRDLADPDGHLWATVWMETAAAQS